MKTRKGKTLKSSVKSFEIVDKKFLLIDYGGSIGKVDLEKLFDVKLESDKK